MSDIETKTDPEKADALHDVNGSSPDAPLAATVEKPGKVKKPKGLFESVMSPLSSFGFTCIILLCLMVLTYFGTYAQKSIGLVKAQEVYFDSFICRINFAAFDLPDLWIRFPGAFLLLILLAVNLICGGMVRIKWRRRNTGILIGHFGIIFLLIAGLVKFSQSTNGYVQLWPNEKTSIYTSFHEWEIAIGEQLGDGTVREHLIPGGDLERHGSFHSSKVPFRLIVDDYFENCRPRSAKTSLATNVVDGVLLEEMPWVKQAPMNTAGAYVTVHADGEKPLRGLLFGHDNHPWTVTVKGVPWTIDLRKCIFDLPFEVRLDEFRKKEHPGVSTPMLFESDVTKIDNGTEQKFHIAMNNPMRYGGFMLSQNNWGPQDNRPGPYYSVLEVSSNPSDQWPKYACFVIAFGLLIHMLTKLAKHVNTQNALRRTV